MKTKHNSQFGFFNLRVLIGLLIALTAVILALLGFGTFGARAASMKQAYQSYIANSVNPLVPPDPALDTSASTTRCTINSIDPLVPAGFDCSRIHELGIDKQVNLRAGAIMIFCGEAQGGSASPTGTFPRLVQKLLQPLVYGTTDVDLITGTETYPHVTQ